MKNHQKIIKNTISYVLLVIGVILCQTLLALDNNGFVPVDPANINPVSGKLLMFISYGIIVSVIVFYSIFIHLKNKRIKNAILSLQQQLLSTNETANKIK